jgi:hypothetical protein
MVARVLANHRPMIAQWLAECWTTMELTEKNEKGIPTLNCNSVLTQLELPLLMPSLQNYQNDRKTTEEHFFYVYERI